MFIFWISRNVIKQTNNLSSIFGKHWKSWTNAHGWTTEKNFFKGIGIHSITIDNMVFFFIKKTCWGKICKVIRQGKSLILAHCPPSLRSCCKVWKRFPFLYFVASRKQKLEMPWSDNHCWRNICLYAVVTKDKTWDASADIVSVLRQTTS